MTNVSASRKGVEMKNNKEKCKNCTVGIYRNKNLLEFDLVRIPAYCFPYAVKLYKYCPYCGIEIFLNDKNELM